MHIWFILTLQVSMCEPPSSTGNALDVLRVCGAMVQLTRLLRVLRKTGPSENDLAIMWQPIEGAEV